MKEKPIGGWFKLFEQQIAVNLFTMCVLEPVNVKVLNDVEKEVLGKTKQMFDTLVPASNNWSRVRNILARVNKDMWTEGDEEVVALMLEKAKVLPPEWIIKLRSLKVLSVVDPSEKIKGEKLQTVSKSLDVKTHLTKYNGKRGGFMDWFSKFQLNLRGAEGRSGIELSESDWIYYFVYCLEDNAFKLFTVEQDTLKAKRKSLRMNDLVNLFAETFDEATIGKVLDQLSWIKQQMHEDHFEFKFRWSKLKEMILRASYPFDETTEKEMLLRKLKYKDELSISGHLMSVAQIWANSKEWDRLPKYRKKKLNKSKSQNTNFSETKSREKTFFTLKNGKQVDLKKIICHKCKRKGHFAWMKDKCTLNDEKEEKADETHFIEEVAEDLQQFCLYSDDEKNFSEVKSDNMIEFVEDTGGPNHIVNDKSWFVSMKEAEDGRVIRGGSPNDVGVPVEGVGDVVFLHSETGKLIRLTDVCYVPKYVVNLFSTRKAMIACERNKIRIKEVRSLNRMELLVDKTSLIKAEMKGVHWKFIGHRVQSNEDSIYLFSKVGKTRTLLEWHERLGHCSYDSILRMVNHEMIDGMEVTGVKTIKDLCVDCRVGKMVKKRPESKIRYAEVPLEVIQCDWSGKMPLKSRTGKQYFSVFVDQFSRRGKVYLHSNKTKETSLQNFKEFKTKYENLLDYKIKMLINDEGTEFSSLLFKNYLNAEGIVLKETNLDSPEENSLAERYIRKVKDMATTVLNRSGVPDYLWEDAIKYADDTLDVIPVKNVLGVQKTPYELFFGKKPSITHFRPFGCEAVVHVPKVKRNRRKSLKEKGKKGVFIGYDDVKFGYRIYIPKSRKVIISKDVEFNESVFPYDIIRKRNEEKLMLEELTLFSKMTSEELKLFEEFYEEFCFLQNGDQLDVPSSFAVAFQDDGWRKAIELEMKKIKDRKTWKLVVLPEGKRALKNGWTFAIKKCSDGTVERLKARFFVKGYDQKFGVDYFETFAPVLKLTTLRLILALKAKLKLKGKQADVTNAFLYATVEEEIYMEQPEGFVDPERPHLVCRMLKSLYGLKQAPKLWYERLCQVFLNQGFQRSSSDPCLLYKFVGNRLCIVTIYVDDLLLLSDCQDLLDLCEGILKENFEIKEFDKIEWILGISVEEFKEGLFLSQRSFCVKLLNKFEMLDCKSQSVAIQIGFVVSTTAVTVPYRELVGSLMYLMLGTRPDIAFAVGYLSRFLDCYTLGHWKMAKGVLRYIKGTLEYGLFYKSGSLLGLVFYCDSDYAGCIDTRRSTSGYVGFFGECLFSWRSARQKCVTLSSTEAEYVSLCDCCKEGIWIRNILRSIKQWSDNSIVSVFGDNQSALKIAKNFSDCKGRTKHIDVKLHFSREQVLNGSVELHYVRSEDNPSDLMTKAVGPNKLVHLMELMRVEKKGKY